MSASAVFQCTLKLCKQLDSFNCATMATIQNQVMLLFLASRGPCLAKLMRIPSNQEIKLFLNNYKLFWFDFLIVMYYGKEKQHGIVFSILVYLGITYKNENKITTCFRKNDSNSNKESRICMNRMGIFKHGLDFFSLRVNLGCW